MNGHTSSKASNSNLPRPARNSSSGNKTQVSSVNGNHNKSSSRLPLPTNSSSFSSSSSTANNQHSNRKFANNLDSSNNRRNSAGTVGTGPHSAPNMGSRKNGTISDEPKPRQKENKGNENSDSLIDALISSKKEKER